jgi:Mg/Co/Ni transporter MgtE
MYAEPVAVKTGASQEEVTDLVARYNLLAVPVVDDEGRLEGIVTVDDAMDTLMPQPSKRRIPRLFSRSGTAER